MNSVLHPVWSNRKLHKINKRNKKRKRKKNTNRIRHTSFLNKQHQKHCEHTHTKQSHNQSKNLFTIQHKSLPILTKISPDNHKIDPKTLPKTTKTTPKPLQNRPGRPSWGASTPKNDHHQHTKHAAPTDSPLFTRKSPQLDPNLNPKNEQKSLKNYLRKRIPSQHP